MIVWNNLLPNLEPKVLIFLIYGTPPLDTIQTLMAADGQHGEQGFQRAGLDGGFGSRS